MCTLLEARQREALPLMSSHQRCPLFGVVLPHPGVLAAPGTGHRSAQPDGCALFLTAKVAAHSKHSGFIITSSLLPKPDCKPRTWEACPHLGRERCYDRKLDVTSVVLFARSGHRPDPALWNNDGFASLPIAVMNLADKPVAGGNNAYRLTPGAVHNIDCPHKYMNKMAAYLYKVLLLILF